MTEQRSADRERAERLRRSATYASVSVASILILAKLAAYVATDSVSVLSALIDSTTDLMASLVTLYGVHRALRPPDAQHRYGHGKAEALAALAQAAFISGSAVFLVIEAARRLIQPEPFSDGWVGVAVMGLAMVLSAGLVAYQRHVVAVTGSVAISADKLHYSGDLYLNGSVIVAILLAMWTGLTVFDPLFALGIAAFLLNGARAIAGEALDVLMDRELPQGDRDRIRALVDAHEGALGMHDLRTRSSGTSVFIELHLELDPTINVAEAHAVTDEVERILRGAFPGAEVIIHQEPAGLDDERLDERIRGAARA